MSRLSFWLAAFAPVLALAACDASVDVVPPKPGDGIGGAGPTTASTSQSGTGGAGGMGGAGGEACEGGLGTECEPNRKGLLFEGSGSARVVAIDSAGDVVIGGQFTKLDLDGELLTSAGKQDLFVAKLDGETGTVVWSRSFGTTDYDQRIDLALDADDNIVFTGTATAKIDFGGGLVCDDGFGQVFLVKLDAAGEHVFSRCFGDPATSTGGPQPQVAVTPSGEIVLFGGSHYDVDMGSGLLPFDAGVLFVAAYTADGQGLWSRKYGELDPYPNVYARDLAIDPEGRIVLGIDFYDVLDFEGLVTGSMGGAHGLVVTLEPTGEMVWGVGLNGDLTRLDLAVGPSREIAVGTAPVSAVVVAGVETAVDGTIIVLDAQGALGWAGGPSDPLAVEAIDIDSKGTLLAVARLAPAMQPAGPDLSFSAFLPGGRMLFERSFGSGTGFGVAVRGDKVALCGSAGDDPGLDFGDGLLVSNAKYGMGVFAAWFEPWQSAAPEP